jgi:hypothetical protein
MIPAEELASQGRAGWVGRWARAVCRTSILLGSLMGCVLPRAPEKCQTGWGVAVWPSKREEGHWAFVALLPLKWGWNCSHMGVVQGQSTPLHLEQVLPAIARVQSSRPVDPLHRYGLITCCMLTCCLGTQCLSPAHSLV